MPRTLFGSLALATGLFLLSTPSPAADWPQWQGPDRTAVSKETGLLKAWPKDGPPLAWKVDKLGLGFGTPIVVGGKIYGMGTRDGQDGIWALQETDGKELWFTKFDEPRKTNQNNGPSGSPTFHDGKLFTLSSKGKLVCLEAASGKEIWKVDFVKDFGGSVPGWGYTESVLIDGDKLICTPGGKNTIVALKPATGEVIWKAAVPKSDGAHYASAIVAEIAGQRQYIQFVKGGVVSVGASDGAFLWRYDHPANGTANCSTPIYFDGHIFAASAYGNGGGLAKVTKAEDKYEAKEVYFDKEMQNHHGGMVLIDGFVYGEGRGKLRCLNFKTGELAWEDGKPGKGSVSAADGMLYFRTEGSGRMTLAEANPKEFVEKGTFTPPDRSKSNAWAHPVIANGKLYLRDQDVLQCYDVKLK